MEDGEKNKDIDVVKTSEISVIEKDENDNFESHRKLSVSSISSSLSHESVSNAFSRATDTSDMRLIVEGKPLYVSRLVLSIISPVFKEMFERRARELSLFEIPLSGRKYDEMLEFLYSVYPDSLKPISDENLSVLLKLSEEYKVQTLKNRCSQFMLRQIENGPKSLPVEQLVWFMKLADHYKLETIIDKAIEQATRTPSDLLENNSEFYDLSPTTTTKIFMGRLRLFEKAHQKIQKKVAEIEAHCSVYHKKDSICTKCYVSIGKLAVGEFLRL
ncbi:unnamed protein product [Mytilus edulis]|uniref:BTB domain-containing protein n=1 Tax=Mytilus edulis TaxID=6550 RepID=A0A8S3SEY6_MYTED|nr:unnamed protein product [Mytilus edulis]